MQPTLLYPTFYEHVNSTPTVHCFCRRECEDRRDAWKQEMQSCEQDLALLKQYRDTDTATDPKTGQSHRAR